MTAELPLQTDPNQLVTIGCSRLPRYLIMELYVFLEFLEVVNVAHFLIYINLL